MDKWKKVREFLESYRELDVRNASVKSLRGFLLEEHRRVFGEDPPEGMPWVVVKAKIAYTLQALGFKEAGCKDELSPKVKRNFLALYRNDMSAMDPESFTSLQIDIKTSPLDKKEVEKEQKEPKKPKKKDVGDETAVKLREMPKEEMLKWAIELGLPDERVEKYKKLNNAHFRMTLGNFIRHKLKKKEES